MTQQKFFLIAIFGMLMFSCSDDLQNDIDDLKERVEALEATEVAGIEFQGNDLIVTFGDGSTASATAPIEVIPDHVSDFQINNDEGIISVTFSDGTTKDYIVLSNGNTTYLSASLSGDYGITSMTIGDVTLANLGYDDQNRVVEALINLPDGNGNVINILELRNNYSDANPTLMAIEKTLYSDIDYFVDQYLSSYITYFADYQGSYFVEGDGEMYTLYRYPNYDGTQYGYTTFDNCWFVADNDINYNSYEKYYPVAGEDSLFYMSYNNYQWMSVDGVYGRVYYPDRIINVSRVYQPGEAVDTTQAKLTMRGDLIEKVEYLEPNTEVVSTYFEMTYDASDLMKQVDLYDIDYPAGAEPDTFMFGRFLMTNTEDLLSMVEMVSFNQDGSVAENMILAEFVYDDVGNPVEIWAVPGYETGSAYIFSTDASGKITIEPMAKEIKKIVEIEYNYTLPNFFGKTLEYLVPELKGLKITNAPVRLTHTGFYDFVNMEYFDFNEGGYPGKVKMEAYISSMYYGGVRKGLAPSGGFITTPVGTEMLLEYILFE